MKTNFCVVISIFLSHVRVADVTSVFEIKDFKDNYGHISILPNIFKIYERHPYNQNRTYLSKYQCGFHKGFNAQHCLESIVERRKENMDNGRKFGALMTDLSKSFDCLHHGLLIAKLEAYSFDIK